jgi:hypothetical protein
MMARTKGFFVSFDCTHDALTETDASFRKSGRIIMLLTVREILDEPIARKLAQPGPGTDESTSRSEHVRERLCVLHPSQYIVEGARRVIVRVD